MTATELKSIFDVVCCDCKGRGRCMIPDCQGLADALTTSVEEAVAVRLEKAEEMGPELLAMLKKVVERMYATPNVERGEGLMLAANTTIAKAEGRE